MEIDQQLFALAQEQWKIFGRWSQAFKTGTVSLDSRPALPEDRARCAELQNIIGDRLKLQSAKALTRRARFVGLMGFTAIDPLPQVEWSEPSP